MHKNCNCWQCKAFKELDHVKEEHGNDFMAWRGSFMDARARTRDSGKDKHKEGRHSNYGRHRGNGDNNGGLGNDRGETRAQFNSSLNGDSKRRRDSNSERSLPTQFPKGQGQGNWQDKYLDFSSSSMSSYNSSSSLNSIGSDDVFTDDIGDSGKSAESAHPSPAPSSHVNPLPHLVYPGDTVGANIHGDRGFFSQSAMEHGWSGSTWTAYRQTRQWPHDSI